MSSLVYPLLWRICVLKEMEATMTSPLELLSDCIEKAHARIQKDFSNINPVVGVSRKLRTMGIPADVITIDCLKSRKRIIVIFHEELPDMIRYQFSFIEKDPDESFEEITVSDLSENHLYDWMRSYFS